VFEQFIAMTRSIIERDGLEGYLPTLLLPQRQDIRVLDDAPQEEEHESIATAWAAEVAEDEENYLLAFRASASHFKVVARLDGQLQTQLCEIGAA